MKKVAEGNCPQLLKELCLVAYAVNTCIIPKTEASITTHFQQYVLFSFIFIYFMTVKIQLIKFWCC